MLQRSDVTPMPPPNEPAPETMVSPETGQLLRRGVRPFVVSYRGHGQTVELAGYYPEEGDNGIHIGDDMAVTDAALRQLKEVFEGPSR